MNKELVALWINKAVSLDQGESLFLPSESRDHARSMQRMFRRELRKLTEINPITGNKISIHISIRDGTYWLELRRIYNSPLVGYIKKKNSETVRVQVTDPERVRRLECMKEDGYTLKEVEAIEGPLTEEERRIFNERETKT